MVAMGIVGRGVGAIAEGTGRGTWVGAGWDGIAVFPTTGKGPGKVGKLHATRVAAR
jgi:hypothetical protein